jgi:hypothetical protein
VVVDLDEDLGSFAVGEGKSLFVPQLAEEGDFSIEVADAKGDVRDADDALIWRRWLRDGSRGAGADDDKRQQQAESGRNSQKNLQSPVGGEKQGKEEKSGTAEG